MSNAMLDVGRLDDIPSAWLDAAGYEQARLDEVCPVGTAVGDFVGDIKFHRVGEGDRGVWVGVLPLDPKSKTRWTIKFQPIDLGLSKPYSLLHDALVSGVGRYFLGKDAGWRFPIEHASFRSPHHAQTIGVALYDLWLYRADGALRLIEALHGQIGEWRTSDWLNNGDCPTLPDAIIAGLKLRIAHLDPESAEHDSDFRKLISLEELRRSRRESA